MDKLTQYQQYIQELLTEYARDNRLEEGIETQLVFDTQRDHYQWSNVGWNGLHRVYHCIMHLDITAISDQTHHEKAISKAQSRDHNVGTNQEHFHQ